jgi:hypothetical protein
MSGIVMALYLGEPEPSDLTLHEIRTPGYRRMPVRVDAAPVSEEYPVHLTFMADFGPYGEPWEFTHCGLISGKGVFIRAKDLGHVFMYSASDVTVSYALKVKLDDDESWLS